MRKILKIAQREYAASVKTKTFVIGILMVPLIIGAIIFFTGYVTKEPKTTLPPRKIAFRNLSNEKRLSSEIQSVFDDYNKSHEKTKIQVEEALADQDPNTIDRQQKDKVRHKKLDAYIVMEENILDAGGKVSIYKPTTKAADLDFVMKLEDLFRRAVINTRYTLQDIDRKLLNKLRWVSIEQIALGPKAQEKKVNQVEEFTKIMVPFFFMFLMFMGIFGMGQHMVTSIIEEKSSRVIEVLLSAVSPFEFMAGKILGLGAVGLTMMGIWAVASYFSASWRGLHIELPYEMIFYFIVYYVLGFLLLSSILAGIGSICNTLKEAQNLLMPVNLLFILPMMAWFLLARYPQGTLARVFSFVPPLTPMVMILRLSATSGLSVIEISASIILLAVSVLAAIWAAAKIFRTGILMYGKRPAIPEVVRWLKQK